MGGITRHAYATLTLQASMKLNDLTAVYLFHPKSRIFLEVLCVIVYILSGAFLTLVVCYYIGILDVSPEEMRAIMLVFALLFGTFLIGSTAFVMYVNMAFNKSYISAKYFAIRKRHSLKLDYDYIEALLPKLEEICGEITVRAIYAFETSKSPADETPHLSTGYRDTWTNNPSRKIVGILFESAENSTGRRLKLFYLRSIYPVVMYYTGSYLEGEGFNQDDREQIINVIENEQWRLKPKYSLLVNIGLGFTYFVFVLASLFFNYVYWDDSYGYIAWCVANIVILGLLILILCVKCLIFPDGAFSIDHEAEEIKKRERTQEKIIGYIEKSFGGLIKFLLVLFGIRFI